MAAVCLPGCPPPVGRTLGRALPLLLILVLLVAPPASWAGPVSGIARDPSGIGSVLPGGLWLSGDLTLSGDVPEGRPAFGEIDDLRLLARFERFSRLAFFGELRFEDLVEVIAGEGIVTRNAEAVVERLYAEALITPQLSLRLGKIFTPFGLWNVISRAPLTWTVEEPAVTETEIVFPGRVTGLSLLYRETWRGWSVDATAYGPAQDEIRIHKSHDSASGLLFGGRVAAGRNVGPAFASLGLNAAGFRSYARRCACGPRTRSRGACRWTIARSPDSRAISTMGYPTCASASAGPSSHRGGCRIRRSRSCASRIPDSPIS